MKRTDALELQPGDPVTLMSSGWPPQQATILRRVGEIGHPMFSLGLDASVSKNTTTNVAYVSYTDLKRRNP